MTRPKLPRWWRAAVPALALAPVVAVKLLWLPWLGSETPSLLFLPAVILAAWLGGPAPGLATLTLSLALIFSLFQAPGDLRDAGNWQQRVRVGHFTLEGLLVCALVAALDRSRRMAERAASERAAGERRYRRLVETASEGIWIFDARGRTSYANPRMAAMLGYKPEELEGRSVSEFFDERGRDDRHRVLRRRREDSREHFEFRYRRRDGSPLHALVSLSPIYDDDGAFSGTLAMITDVTRRRQAEDARRASEDQLRFALEAARIGSWQWDLATGTLRWSENLEPLHGLEPGTFGGTIDAFNELVHPSDRAALSAAIHQALSGAGEFEREFRVVWPDGTVRWMFGRGRAFRGADGRPARLVGIGMDVTDRKRVEEGLAFLAEAGATLASSLDYEATLATVARLAVPRIADGCAIDMVEPDGLIRRLAAHPDPARKEAAIEVARRFPPATSDEIGCGWIVAHGSPQVIPQVTQDVLEAKSGGTPEHLRLLRELGLASFLGVPLLSQGRTLGAISLVAVESGRRFSAEDLPLAEALAARVAAAIENARLYRQAQDALRTKDEAVALLDTLFSTAPVGFAFLDPDRRFVRINPQMARFNGFSPEEHLGRTPAELNPHLDGLLGPHLDRVLATGLPVLDVEVGGETRDLPGVRRDFLASYYPVRAGADSPLGVGVVVVEITERTRVERELREAKRAADEANLSKDRFLAVLSHELRTPLTPVLATVTAMLDDPTTPEEFRPTLELTRRNVELEARLIDDLLDITRIAKGKLPLHVERCDAHVLIRRALEMCQGPPETPRCELVLAATESHVEADTARLQQVFWNLLKNALKFTPPGGRVAIRTANRPSDPAAGDPGAPGSPLLVVEVRDEGVGIDPSALPRIFDAFEQGHPSITRRYGGLGLGLAISRSVVDALGGRIRAESDGPGLGSCFTVELPARPAPTRASAPAEPAPAGGDGDGRRLRVLLIDDDADTLAVVARLLRRRGHDVTTGDGVASGLAAFERAAGAFDVLVTDLGLPDGSGYDLLQVVRAQAPGLPALALSGYGMESDLRRSEESGFAAHLIKPINFAVLDGLLRKVRPPRALDGRPAAGVSD